MKHALEYIAQRLDDCKPIVTLDQPRSAPILYLQLPGQPDVCPPERTLYVLDAGQVQAGRELPLHFLYCAPQPIPVPEGHNRICLKQPPEPERVRAAVEEVAAFFDRHHQLLEDVVFAMTKPDSLQRTVDLCYDFWASPVSLYDTSFKLLAASSQYTPQDTRIRQVTDAGHMSMDSIQLLRRQKRLDAYYGREPYKLTYPESISPRDRIKGQDFGYVDVPVRDNGKVIACMALIAQGRRMDEMDADCLLELSGLVSVTLQRDGAYMQSVANRFEMLFRDILKGNLKEDAAIEARFAGLGKQLKARRRILVIPLEGRDSEDKNRRSDALQNELRETLPTAVSAYYHERIVLLLSADYAVSIDESTRFLAYLKINRLHAGVSREFTALSQIRQHYDQAQAALRLGLTLYPDRPYHLYDQYSLSHELEILSQSADLTQFCHPGLLAMANSKKRSDRELLVTLYSYLILSRDVQKLCEQLHIHRSTLFYRIKKAREVLDVDLESSWDLYFLMRSFHILRYTGLLEP